jgi:hypothetical protein
MNQTENAKSKKIKTRIYDFLSGRNQAFWGEGGRFLVRQRGREYLLTHSDIGIIVHCFISIWQMK